MNFKQNCKDSIVRDFGEPATMEELFYTTIKVINRQLANSKREKKDNRVLGLAWTVSRSDHMRNSHNCPINGVTNFSTMENTTKAKGYPGYSGRVWVRYAHKPHSFGASDLFHYALSYPGTGGSGSYSGPWRLVSSAWFRSKHLSDRNIPEPILYSWDYKIWEDDWPLIAENYSKRRMIDLIKHGADRMPVEKSNLEWNDPETAAADLVLMQAVKDHQELEQNTSSMEIFG